MKWHQDAVEDIRQIIALDSQRKPMYEFEIIARLQHFWKLLCANTLSQASAPSGQDEENYRRIRRIMSYIAEHYSEKIQLEDIASHPPEPQRVQPAFQKVYEYYSFRIHSGISH